MQLIKPTWSTSSTAVTDFTLHQLAPYIGRMKTSMAGALVKEYSRKGDLIVDPFCGCGVLALEAAVLGRRVVCGDWNSYAVLLTRAKLFPPVSLKAAERRLKHTWELALTKVKDQDLRSAPKWVRSFFHPETLRPALAFRDACIEREEHFLLACLLGILHHQRAGISIFPEQSLSTVSQRTELSSQRLPASIRTTRDSSTTRSQITAHFQTANSPLLSATKNH